MVVRNAGSGEGMSRGMNFEDVQCRIPLGTHAHTTCAVSTTATISHLLGLSEDLEWVVRCMGSWCEVKVRGTSGPEEGDQRNMVILTRRWSF